MRPPQITKHRGARSRKGDYFGPFASVWAVNRTLNALERAFLLRSCSDSYFENRTRPAFSIRSSAARRLAPAKSPPPTMPNSSARRMIFSSGKSRAVRDHAGARNGRGGGKSRIRTRGALARPDRRALGHPRRARRSIPKTVEGGGCLRDRRSGRAVLHRGFFFFRTYQNWGNRAYFPRADKSYEQPKCSTPFWRNFTRTCRRRAFVLLSHGIENHALLAEALCIKAGHKVEIIVPAARREKRARRARRA